MIDDAVAFDQSKKLQDGENSCVVETLYFDSSIQLLLRQWTKLRENVMKLLHLIWESIENGVKKNNNVGTRTQRTICTPIEC